MTGSSERIREDRWASARPRRECESLTDGDRAELLMPRYGRGRVARWLRRRINPSPVRIHLDDIGTFVWSRCDGRHSVDDIAAAMRHEFGERAEPVEERLLMFLKKLLREKLIALDGR